MIEEYIDMFTPSTWLGYRLLGNFVLGFWIFMFVASFLAIMRSYHFRREVQTKKPQYVNRKAPGVSIIRPLRGVDNCLEQCLISSFESNYPKFEVIFCVPDESDSAIPVVQQLIARYPHVDAKLMIGEIKVGVNPKINNLIRGYLSAKYNIVWILDSNIAMTPNSMDSAVTALMEPNVGLVHHVPRGTDAQNFGAMFEALYLGVSHFRMYMLINTITSLAHYVGINGSCVIGKSMLFRRSDLKKAGDLTIFGKYLAEDNVIGQAIASLGLAHKIVADLASQKLGECSAMDYVARRVRWARLRLYIVPIATLIEPFTECLVCGISAAVAAYCLYGFSPAKFFLIHCIAWFTMDTILYTQVNNSIPPLKTFALIWILREISFLPIFLYGISGNTVEWRGKTYYLQIGGTATLEHRASSKLK